jgi:hypothetical protein
MFQAGNQGKLPATFRAVITDGDPGVSALGLTLVTPFLFVLRTESVLTARTQIG